MSRTDVHRPLWVQQNDPTIRHWFADFHHHHHHEHGACDLVEFLATPGWARTRCYRQLWRQAPRLCGCRMCTAHHYRKQEHRAHRTRWRAVSRQLRALVAANRDVDLDVAPPRRTW